MGETKRRNRAAWRTHILSRYPGHTPEEALRAARWNCDGEGEEPGIPGHRLAGLAEAERKMAARHPGASWSRVEYARQARHWLSAAREDRDFALRYHGPLLAGMEVPRGS